jgi:hypothetical protein
MMVEPCNLLFSDGLMVNCMVPLFYMKLNFIPAENKSQYFDISILSDLRGKRGLYGSVTNRTLHFCIPEQGMGF